MSKDRQRVTDANEDAARVVRESTSGDAMPADLEAAWAQWSKSIMGVDERGMTLLRAAFEAGYAAASSS